MSEILASYSVGGVGLQPIEYLSSEIVTVSLRSQATGASRFLASFSKAGNKSTPPQILGNYYYFTYHLFLSIFFAPPAL